jgi:uncharacterized protein (TIGR03437 family)
MTLLFQKKYPVVLAAAVLSCMAASERLAAATNVTYAAFGTFSSPQISGADVFQLRGQPFSINVVASETLVSKNHGAQWALYTMLKMTGTVQSGLLPTPIAISSNSSSILLAAGNPSQDSFMLGSPVKVVGTTLTVTANIIMPKGTITNDHVLPFTAPVTLTPANATMTYSDGTNTTTLGINGTLTATVPGTAADVSVRLHGDGAQAITMHADGAQSVQSIGARSVDLGTPSDVVVLQFYASGVRDAGEVRVQIGGEDAAVLYAGAAERFSGLDQVSVQVPRSLAGRGAVEVLLTVGGQTAGPVRLQIQ